MEQPQENTWLKWVILAMCCFGSFSSYMGFYFPTVLEKQVMHDLGLSYTQFNMLYSLQSLPNIIIPLFAGAFIGRIGAATAMLALAMLKLIGAVLWVIAINYNNFFIFALGRFVFGCTVDPLWIATNLIIAQYFGPSQQQGIALNIVLMTAGLGQFLSSILLPYYYTISNSLYTPMLALSISSAMALVAAIFMIMIEKKFVTGENRILINTCNSDQFNFQGSFFEAWKQSPKLFLKLIILCFLGYMAFYGVLINLQGFFQNFYDLSDDQLGDLSGINFFAYGMMFPIFGYLQDITGKRTIYQLVSFFGWTGSLLMIQARAPSEPCLFTIAKGGPLFEQDFCLSNVYLPMILLGIFQSLFEGSLWVAVQIVVKQELLSICTGISSSAYNLGIVIISLIAGFLLDKQGTVQGYQTILFLETGLSITCLFYAVHIYYDDLKNGSILYERVVKHYQIVLSDDGAEVQQYLSVEQRQAIDDDDDTLMQVKPVNELDRDDQLKLQASQEADPKAVTLQDKDKKD